jgi:NADH-quinone oxidoreductase subunit C
MAATLQEIAGSLETRFSGRIESRADFRGETTLTVAAGALHDLLRHCRDALGFDYLIDISSVDHFGDDPRFEVVYELYSLQHRNHLRIKAKVDELTPELPTATDLWPTADWHEREVFDMMGIRFTGHPDLRRILMWDGYPYFPLRKDFPLEGRDSAVPEVAFTAPAPLEGGPFVTIPSEAGSREREPRARGPLPER